MVVVLCYKVEMIDEPHGLFQSRVQQGAGEGARREFLCAIH